MKSFRIKNMKSFVDSGVIDVHSINIFVGKNSCGKSSLLRFPAVMAQSFTPEASNPISFYGKYVDYGTFESVLHKSQIESGQTMSFEINHIVHQMGMLIGRHFKNKDKMDDYKKLLGEFTSVSLRVEIEKVSKQIRTKSIEIYLNNKLFLSYYREAEDENFFNYCVYLNPTADGFMDRTVSISLKPTHYRAFMPASDRIHNYFYADDIEFPMEMFTFDANVEREDLRDQLFFAHKLEDLVVRLSLLDSERTTYIGPFRENPQRIYRDTENGVVDVGSRGENLGMLLMQETEKDSETLRFISAWLKENYGYSLEVNSTVGGFFNIMLVDDNGVKSNLMDVGYGISQVLPIIIQLIKDTREAEMSRLFIIEQPELHLHPAAQANLADLFVQAVNEKGHALMIETHSEHLIRKIQVLVAQGKIDADWVAVYSVEKDEEGNAFVNRMPLNSEGRFTTKWPSGFFDKSHELASALRAANRTEE